MSPPLRSRSSEPVRARRSSQRTWGERDLSLGERRICNDADVMDGNKNPQDAYVRAALALQGYQFDAAQIAEITLAFARIEAMTRTIYDWPMPEVSEAAPVFRP